MLHAHLMLPESGMQCAASHRGDDVLSDMHDGLSIDSDDAMSAKNALHAIRYFPACLWENAPLTFLDFSGHILLWIDRAHSSIFSSIGIQTGLRNSPPDASGAVTCPLHRIDTSCSPSQLGNFLRLIARRFLIYLTCLSHGAMIGRRRLGESLLLVSSLGLRHLGAQLLLLALSCRSSRCW